jgi:predicted transcriptional regulator
MEISFTDREADIMGVLWRRGPSTVAEVRAELHDELAYTTVLTMLRTLQGKGYVGYEEEGRTYRYFAAVEQQDARKSALRHLAEKMFDGSPELLLTHLVSAQKLDRKQLQRIRKLLDEKAGKGRS